MASLPVRDRVSLAAELQRDRARDETAEGVGVIVLTERLLRA